MVETVIKIWFTCAHQKDIFQNYLNMEMYIFLKLCEGATEPDLLSKGQYL